MGLGRYPLIHQLEAHMQTDRGVQVAELTRPLTARAVKTTAAASPGQSSLANALRLMGAAISYGRNEEIYGEDEPSEFVYMVARGAIRTYKLLSDGRRQIAAFRLPGDIFGLEVGHSHVFTAEAIADSEVIVVKRGALMALAARDGAIARDMWAETARDLERAQDLLLLLGRKSAQERVATFLLEMADRVADGATIELPMSRQDIADYLGLTIETVSRTLSQMEHSRTIALPTCRRVELCNRNVLSRLNS
jgi:CRP/FNR family nitrogen fixation transcriptional regulator